VFRGVLSGSVPLWTSFWEGVMFCDDFDELRDETKISFFSSLLGGGVSLASSEEVRGERISCPIVPLSRRSRMRSLSLLLSTSLICCLSGTLHKH